MSIMAQQYITRALIEVPSTPSPENSIDQLSDSLVLRSLGIVDYLIPIIQQERTKLAVAVTRDISLAFVTTVVAIFLLAVAPALSIFVLPAYAFVIYAYWTHKTAYERVAYAMRRIDEELGRATIRV